MSRAAARAGIVLMGTLLAACAGCVEDLSGFTLFEFSQIKVPDNYRYPDVLWARIRLLEGEYLLQMALIDPELEEGVLLAPRVLTADEVARVRDVFASISFWYDFSGLTDSRAVVAPFFRWDDLVSQPGNTFSVITTDSQTAVVTLLRELVTADGGQ